MLKHIGLIPDGNRRWAKKISMNYFEAYVKTMERVIECVEMFFNVGFSSCSVYLHSKDNLYRKRDDLNALFKAETVLISKLLPDVIDKLKCRIILAGRESLLPAPMCDFLKELQIQTKNFSQRTMYLLIGYDPIDELEFAKESTIQMDKAFNISPHLWVPEHVDVVIRTAGGPTLLSNFLPIQCGYAQIYMLEEFFPDCTNNQFLEIIEKAKSIKMLYGS